MILLVIIVDIATFKSDSSVILFKPCEFNQLLMYNDEAHIGTQSSLKHTERCTVWFFQNIDQKRSCTKHINWFILQW